MKSPLAPLSAALMLSACAATGSADLEAVAPPEANRAFLGAAGPAFAAAEAPQDWWRLFDDPTLDGLVAEALAANKDLEIAAANLARVRASLGETRARSLPMTTTTAGASYGREQMGEEDWSYNAGLDVSYEVDLFGRVRSTIAAARADVEAAEAAMDVVRVSVAAETARAYADACAAGARIAVGERTVDLQDHTLRLTTRLLDAGRGNGLDVARAAAALEAGRAGLPPLRAARDEAVFRLATLTGRSPAQASPQAIECNIIPQVTTAIPVGDGASLLARRPDVRQAEEELSAAIARTGVAAANFYPRITLGGSLGSTAPAVSGLTDSGAVRFSVGPLISWSFLNGGIARAQAKAARADAEGALARFDKTVLVALQETETALSAYANELDRRAALKSARDRSAEAARLARLRFDAGMDSFLTVLDAQRTLAADEALLAQSEAQLAANQVQVFKALGGGWAS